MEPPDPKRPLPKTMAIDPRSYSPSDPIPESFGQPASSFGSPPAGPPGWGGPPAPEKKSGSNVGWIALAVVVFGCLGLTAVSALGVVVGAGYWAQRVEVENEDPEWLETPDPPENPDVAYSVPVDPHAAERVYVPIPETVPVRGATEPLVTIVEIADFECPFSARTSTTMQTILQENPEVRLAFRHNPLAMHPNARAAAIASVEARRQFGDAGFWRQHDLLFQHHDALANGGVRNLVAQAGLSTSEYDDAVLRGTHDAVINADVEFAGTVGATGTPTFYINGRELVGAQPIEQFRLIVGEELTHARSMVAAGVPAAHVYARLIENGRRGPAPAAPAREAPDPNVVHRIPILDSPVDGPNDALVTLVVFSDFQCPFCARLAPTLHALRARYGADLRLVYKHNPLAFHPRAEPAAEAAIEVLTQLGPAAFYRFHDAVYENTSALEDADLQRYAREVGANPSTVGAAISLRSHQSVIQRDQALAAAVLATGTPTSFINGRILTGAQPQASFETLIDEELTRARALVSNGTPRDAVYDTIMRTAQ